MRIALLTESLGSGGAERQVCTLAGEFKRRGHSVCVATYAAGDFYRALLEREGVGHHSIGGHGKVMWALGVRRFLRNYGQDVVLAFLDGPSAYAEMAALPNRTWGLVVSERSAGNRNQSRFKAYLHTLADYVITNSHSARVPIEERLPRLRPKLITIYNAVNVSRSAAARVDADNRRGTKLIVAARLDQNKNARGLLSALKTLHDSAPGIRVQVDWYGDQTVDRRAAQAAQQGIIDLGLEGAFRLHAPVSNIHDIVADADAVVLPSFYEGLPNSVCEGMMLGKPILMSAVCDASNLVEDGVNGFLFDPYSPKAIADAIAKFAALTPEDQNRMGRVSRARAEALFDVGIVANRYLRVLEAAAAHEQVRIDHWPCADPRLSRVVRESRTPGY
ncbi:MAG TPA: glycosyltransferase family 4 protein [bacterium]|nr:glycosyltransferase family 4 protein [bacterium]